MPSYDSGHKFEAIWTEIGDTQILESREQKFLGVVIGNDLSFEKFVITLTTLL